MIGRSCYLLNWLNKNNSVLCKIKNFITNKKKVVIVITIVMAIAIIITGIAMLYAAHGFTVNDDTQAGDIGTYNNFIRLNVFRLCFVMLLIVTLGMICIMLAFEIKLEYTALTAVLCFGIIYMFVITPLSKSRRYSSASSK